jgi:hypothetical protein
MKTFLFPGYFREHRGTLRDSMGTIKRVENEENLKELLGHDISHEYYCFDSRIGQNLWIVSSERGVEGFLQYDLSSQDDIK